MEQGTIIRIVSNRYNVRTQEGEDVLCIAMGKLRKAQSPVVGDHVLFERFADQNGIQKVLPRKNSLIRPSIANVDQAMIVMSCKDPDFSTTLIDRLIFQIAYANIKPVLCITKMDLIGKEDEIHQAIDAYRKSGYEVYTTSKDDEGNQIQEAFNHKITVLTGQSGAGKSSLLNRIDPSFQLKTQEISKALGRGKHTTRHCELHPILDGWVADTPGFSSMDFSYMDAFTLGQVVPDFTPYITACKFRDCMHLKEPGCAVLAALDEGKIIQGRHQHYEEVVSMIRQYKQKY